MKKVKIIVEDLRDINYDREAFKVIQLTNTIEFSIGKYLSLGTVTELCNRPNTDIQIVKRKK